jgi:hypothetical protein
MTQPCLQGVGWLPKRWLANINTTTHLSTPLPRHALLSLGGCLMARNQSPRYTTPVQTKHDVFAAAVQNGKIRLRLRSHASSGAYLHSRHSIEFGNLNRIHPGTVNWYGAKSSPLCLLIHPCRSPAPLIRSWLVSMSPLCLPL